ncbi:hypothetical protein HHI36_018263, partial [Cryptolaemus montrouzieri]
MTGQCGERNDCDILMNDGKKITQPEKIVNLLNDYFTEVAEQLITKRYTHHINNNLGKPNVSLYIAKTNEKEIHGIINNLKANGINGIKPKLIKDMTNEITPVLKEYLDVALKINNKIIQQVDSSKYLELVIDYKLKFREHIIHIKIKSMLSVTFSEKTLNTLIQRPNITYNT